MSLRTGPPIGCIAKRSSSSTVGPTSEFGTDYEKLDGEQQAQLSGRLATLMRTNTYDPGNADDHDRSAAGGGVSSRTLRTTRMCSPTGKTDYAIPAGAVTDEARLRQLSAFFFWTAWAASTNRRTITSATRTTGRTSRLVGNRPTGEAVVWTGVSIIMLLAGISAMAWWYASRRAEEARTDCRRKPIRWEAGRPRLRSERRSNTSGSFRL